MTITWQYTPTSFPESSFIISCSLSCTRLVASFWLPRRSPRYFEIMWSFIGVELNLGLFPVGVAFLCGEQLQNSLFESSEGSARGTTKGFVRTSIWLVASSAFDVTWRLGHSSHEWSLNMNDESRDASCDLSLMCGDTSCDLLSLSSNSEVWNSSIESEFSNCLWLTCDLWSCDGEEWSRDCEVWSCDFFRLVLLPNKSGLSWTSVSNDRRPLDWGDDWNREGGGGTIMGGVWWDRAGVE